MLMRGSGGACQVGSGHCQLLLGFAQPRGWRGSREGSGSSTTDSTPQRAKRHWTLTSCITRLALEGPAVCWWAPFGPRYCRSRIGLPSSRTKT